MNSTAPSLDHPAVDDDAVADEWLAVEPPVQDRQGSDAALATAGDLMLSTNGLAHDHAGVDDEPAFPADSLAVGVLALVALTVVQKLVGFARGLLFCRWLGEAELGQWSMAQNFLALAAPLVVLGLPGTFGRYLAHYHGRGLGRTFLAQTLLASAALAGVGLSLMGVGWQTVGWIVYGGDATAELIWLSLVGVATVLLMNVGYEILTAGRQNRSASFVHTAQSVLFAVVGITFLASGFQSAEAVLVAFLIATMAASGLAWGGVLRLWRHPSFSNPTRTTPRSRGHVEASPTRSAVWRQIVPFAASVWAINLLANLFEAADRYVLLHGAGLSAADAIAQIGQYHASLVVPLLISSGGSALAAVALPHLAESWESGHHERLARMQHGLLRLASIGTTTASWIALALAPWLFEVVWDGRFAVGQSVLPLALAHGSLLALVFLTQNELWIRDQGRRGVAVMTLGLIVNVGANLIFAPLWGLPGVVVATLTSTTLTLALMLGQCRRAGSVIPWPIVGLCALPLTLAAGPWLGLSLLMIGLIVATATGWLVKAEEWSYLMARLQGLPTAPPTSIR